MRKAKKLFLVIVGSAAVMMTSAAYAGYYDPWGIYHPTICVPGYWVGTIWIPPVWC